MYFIKQKCLMFLFICTNVQGKITPANGKYAMVNENNFRCTLTDVIYHNISRSLNHCTIQKCFLSNSLKLVHLKHVLY